MTHESHSSLTTEKEWLTAQEAGTYLSLSVGAVRNETSNGKIPHYKFGRRVRYRKADLDNLLLQNRRGGFNGN